MAQNFPGNLTIILSDSSISLDNPLCYKPLHLQTCYHSIVHTIMAKSENEKAPDLIQVSGKSEYSSLKRSHLRSDLKEVKEWSMQISEWISQAGKKKKQQGQRSWCGDSWYIQRRARRPVWLEQKAREGWGRGIRGKRWVRSIHELGHLESVDYHENFGLFFKWDGKPSKKI